MAPALAPALRRCSSSAIAALLLSSSDAASAASAPSCGSAVDAGLGNATCGRLSQPPALLQRRSEIKHSQHGTLEAVATGDNECCAPYSDWHDIDKVTCGDYCTALILTAPYGGRCDKYCESIGHVCVGAAEEMHEDCLVKYTVGCDEPVGETSDMLCRCHYPTDRCAAPTPDSAPPTKEAPDPEHSGHRIQVRGRQLLVDGKPVHMKGVAWNPVGRGGRHPDDVNFARHVAQDSRLMASYGVNAVRTYEPIVDTKVLDTLWEHGIWVVNSVYANAAEPTDVVIGRVNAVKHHPAILMWSIGNEWNYNGLYTGMQLWDSVDRLNEVANHIKSVDSEHPIACIYGDLHELREVDSRMPGIDIWGVNSYRGISFNDLFDDFKTKSSRPLFLGEYGADAWNALINAEDEASQAKATVQLTEEINAHSSLFGGVCIGGFVFELADEWWKDGEGSTWAHDIGGTAPGGGPFPDRTFNEEWWGLVDINRKPRAAMEEYGKISIPVVATV